MREESYDCPTKGDVSTPDAGRPAGPTEVGESEGRKGTRRTEASMQHPTEVGRRRIPTKARRGERTPNPLPTKRLLTCENAEATKHGADRGLPTQARVRSARIPQHTTVARPRPRQVRGKHSSLRGIRGSDLASSENPKAGERQRAPGRPLKNSRQRNARPGPTAGPAQGGGAEDRPATLPGQQGGADRGPGWTPRRSGPKPTPNGSTPGRLLAEVGTRVLT